MLQEVPVQLLHTGVLYLVAFFVIRIMGKRAIGHLAAFDVAVIIMIGEAVAIGIEDTKKPILLAIIPILFLGLLQLILTVVNMFFWQVENVTQGKATILIKDGKIHKGNLWRERVTQADLLTSLREKNVTSVQDVQEARLEPTGQISVIKKASVSPLPLKATGLQGEERLTKVIEGEVAALHQEIRDLARRLDGRPKEAGS